MQTFLNRLLIVIAFILLAMGLIGAELTQREVVAMTILGEARGEGKAGMYAVATVINTRAINREITPRQVCLPIRIRLGLDAVHLNSRWWTNHCSPRTLDYPSFLKD